MSLPVVTAPISAPPDSRGPAHDRPRARGWIHLYSAFGALAVGVTLIIMAGATVSASAAVASAIYAATIVGLFAISATYHRHIWISPRARTWMKRADHSMIFLFIAGTYTPFAVLGIPSRTATVVLVVVWSGALAGVALKMIWPAAPRWLGVPIYLALGWVAVFVIGDIAEASVAALVLMLVGGALYSVGAVFYASRRPKGWPTIFGYHEFFHALVTAAAICHCVAIWLLLY